MQNLKFNPEDTIFKLQFDYFDNPYHFDQIVYEMKVESANERYFHPYYGDAGYQETGANIFNENKKYYHKEKDKELILAEIEKASKKFDDDRKKEDNERIEFLQSEIKKFTDEITEIKKGNGKMKIGFNKYDKKTFKEQVLKKIFEKLNYPD